MKYGTPSERGTKGIPERREGSRESRQRSLRIGSASALRSLTALRNTVLRDCFLRASFLLCFLLFASGCTSFSSLQTGRVLPEGTNRFFVGAGFFRTPEVSPSQPDKVSFPFLEGGGRFGFTEGWDLGMKYTMPGMFTGDLKFNMVDESGFALAAGFGVGYVAVKSDDANDDHHLKREVLDLLFPLYASYDFAPAFGVYLSPRFVLRYAQSQQNLIGSAIGLRFGNFVGIFVEGGAAWDISSNFKQYQVNCGIFFGSGPSVGK
jgi:hypothetical protein